ncbi:hypothetical protein AMTR_s00120p00113440 [Amborella trichopoda]|uniref:Uncharacterized protein n=1 Tax=Amborella trichopoda TaxID=13333 RepID=W1NTV9_AMBTC|nr:hypothetical protein AMTR_s00120p00113440 [Amborella trichopoda]
MCQPKGDPSRCNRVHGSQSGMQAGVEVVEEEEVVEGGQQVIGESTVGPLEMKVSEGSSFREPGCETTTFWKRLSKVPGSP